MDYAITIRVPVPFAEAVARARDALKAQGFGVLTEIDVQATLRDKLGDGLPGLGPHHHVARQQQPDPAVGGQGPVRQRRVAGAKDQVRLHVLTELFPQRRLDVDLG